MTNYRNYTGPDYRFKDDPKYAAPFPPSYYKMQERATKLLAKMTQPRPQKKYS